MSKEYSFKDLQEAYRNKLFYPKDTKITLEKYKNLEKNYFNECDLFDKTIINFQDKEKKYINNINNLNNVINILKNKIYILYKQNQLNNITKYNEKNNIQKNNNLKNIPINKNNTIHNIIVNKNNSQIQHKPKKNNDLKYIIKKIPIY